MSQRTTTPLSELYEADETAWLEAMSGLIAQGRLDDLDYNHLREFLADMARRDRRRVQGRMTVLLTHLLKWEHPPSRRTRSGKTTIIAQRQNLLHDVRSGVLRRYARDDLAAAYADAVERAANETGIPADRFPADCPYTLDQLLTACPYTLDQLLTADVHDAY